MQNFEEYKNQCINDLMLLQPEFMKLYNLDSYEEWFYDHSIGAFHFKSTDGKNLYFKYVDVGSFSTKANTWNWSWDNSTTPRHVWRPLEKVKSFGTINNFGELTIGLFEGDDRMGNDGNFHQIVEYYWRLPHPTRTSFHLFHFYK